MKDDAVSILTSGCFRQGMANGSVRSKNTERQGDFARRIRPDERIVIPLLAEQWSSLKWSKWCVRHV
jgi:hypothetical protein